MNLDQLWAKARDREFEKYYKQRETTSDDEDEAEKTYDTTLITLASLAIGSTFTVLKDVISGVAAALIFLSWFALAVCLFSALVDRLLSYTTHSQWREILDDEFGRWTEGAWNRALARRKDIRFLNVLPLLKWIGFWALLIGIGLLLVGGAVGWHPATPTVAVAPAATQPVLVNVYGGRIQPKPLVDIHSTTSLNPASQPASTQGDR